MIRIDRCTFNQLLRRRFHVIGRLPAYSRLSFGIQFERIEQSYSGGWVNANKTQYQWDALGRQSYEERFDWLLGNWVTRYDITQRRRRPAARSLLRAVRLAAERSREAGWEQNGNRTGYHKNVAGGYESSYGKAYNLSYTFDNVNALSSITDGDDANYSCSVTSDANLNIAQVDESKSGAGAGVLHTYFEYDALNRLTAYKTKHNPFAG